jgi:hypothetical protein
MSDIRPGRILTTLLALTILSTGVQAGKPFRSRLADLRDKVPTWSELIADTLLIPLPYDSLLADRPALVPVRDDRPLPANQLGIGQTKKLRYIPVDQYLTLAEPLNLTLSRVLSDSVPVMLRDTLVIDHLSIWYDGGPVLNKGQILNGYTHLVDSQGTTIRDWQWEIRVKQKRKEEREEYLGRLMTAWIDEQRQALVAPGDDRTLSPTPYGRQFQPWLDVILLPDGYILNSHLTLYYPPDHMRKYVRGAPGIYYRKSSRHESVAIGGKDQQWYLRLGDTWQARFNVTFRFGFNNFNPDYFEYVDWWNIFLMNLGLTAALEYRPVYHRGLYAGLGVHESINILPEVVDRFSPGLLITLGVILP